jgi:hypothetical protein
MQEAPDTLEVQGVVGGEGGGGGAVAVGSDQLGDVAFGEAIAQAPWTRRGWSGGTRRTGERDGVASHRAAAWVECE